MIIGDDCTAQSVQASSQGHWKTERSNTNKRWKKGICKTNRVKPTDESKKYIEYVLGLSFNQLTLTLLACYYCHNPTNNQKQLNTTFVGGVLLLVRKTTTAIFGIQHYYNSTRQYMEDDLNIFYKWKLTFIFFNGRRPHFSVNGRGPQLFQMEDNIKYSSE